MKHSILSKNILLLLISGFFYFASPMLVTPLITGFSESLGAGAAFMGMVGGMMNLCSLFCRPTVGSFIDRVSKYRLSMAGLLLMTAACAGYLFSASPLMVLFFRIVNGAGFALCSSSMSTWVSLLLPPDRIGSGMGIYGMMNALAMAVAPSIGVVLYQTLGYRVSFVIAAVFTALAMVLIQFVTDRGEPVPRPVSSEAGERGNKVTDSPKRLTLVEPKVLPIALIIMLFAIPYCATQSFIVRYTETRSLAVTVSLFFPIYAAALLLLRLTMRNLFDRLRFPVFFAGSSVCAFLAILLLALMQSNLPMCAAAVLMAGGYGIMSSVCQSRAIVVAGREHAGLGNSTYYIGLDLGMTLGPVLGGLLYGSVDVRLFYPLLLLCVPAAVLVFFLNRRTLS
ncbi:MFS transporter [Lachnoclostridium sp. An118]|uniref:MFS transporter n=1 Tax=Lachnoclostridium sp. An118 TaxID=1965547 RepID=UPI000B39E3F4|nr:MFS transporter [Lachnoclostridium sp. An118]OUQ47246.1 MFS transporter [Lachnoclostridium sp. An118]